MTVTDIDNMYVKLNDLMSISRPGVIASIIHTQHPRTISFLLSGLYQKKAREVMALFPPDLQAEVAVELNNLISELKLMQSDLEDLSSRVRLFIDLDALGVLDDSELMEILFQGVEKEDWYLALSGLDDEHLRQKLLDGLSKYEGEPSSEKPKQ